MNTQKQTFKAQDYCSRKLWELVASPAPDLFEDRDLQQAIAELAHRRHYLAQLQALGKLN